MTSSHADFFGRNLVAFPGEMRAVLGVAVPGAFCGGESQRHWR